MGRARAFFLHTEALEPRQHLSGSGDAVLDLNNQVQTYTTLPDTTVTMTGKSELHITGSTTPVTNSLFNLNSADSWLFLDGLKPSVVNSSYLSQVRVNGAAAVVGSNVRVVQYALGTVVIPQGSSFQPLQAFTGPNFTGASLSFGQYNFYDTSAEFGTLFRDLSSFKLKRGYMATLATQSNGSGASKVYVAQDHDLNISLLPTELDNAAQFLRIVPWRWVSKKGASDLSPTTLNASWNYNWNNNQESTLDAEYVPIKQQPFWPSTPTTKQNVTAFLGFNEPNNPVEDSYINLGNGSVDAAINFWPEMLTTGLRIGSPAVTDGGKSWLYEFMDKAIAKGLRVDFIAIHNYQAGNTATSLYNWLKDVWDRYHKPIWLTEFNNGANWTTLPDPTYAENATAIGNFIDMMDNTPWIERYSIYSNVEAVRQMTYADGSLTPAGQVYYNNASPIGYVQESYTTNTQNSGTAQFTMEGTTLDTSGFGNNGQLAGAPNFPSSPRGTSLDFDGASNFVRLSNTVGQGDAFSFAGWVYWDGGANWQRIFDFGVDTTKYFFLSPNSGSNLRFAIKNGGAEQIVQTTPLAIGQWTHVALTLGSSIARLYVNGTQVSTASVTIKPSDIDANANFLGKSTFAADPLFNGQLDDVRFTDTVLSAAQIAALMTDTPPSVSSATITRGPISRGTPFSGTVAGLGSDPDVGDSVTYVKANGPAWLNIAANGMLSGTPTFSDMNPQEFVVAVVDSRGATNYAVLTIALAELYWRGDVNNLWNTSSSGNTNWTTDLLGTTDSGSLPDNLSDLVFAANNAGFLTGILLGGNVSARSLRFISSSSVNIGGANNLTLGSYGLGVMSGAGASSINTTGQLILSANQTWNNSSINTFTVSPVITGPFGLTKTGTGTLLLLGNSLYTGGTIVAAGTLQVGNGGATGSLIGNIVNNGSLLFNRSSDSNIDGVITGIGDLVKQGSGRLFLTGFNSYSGGTTIGAFTGAGVIRAASNFALGSGPVEIGPGGNGTTARLELTGNITLPNAISLPQRTNSTIAIQNVSGNNRLTGAISVTSGGSISIFQSDAGLLTLGAISSATGARTLTFAGAGNGLASGILADGSGTVSLLKSGTGTWTLSAANTYTGSTTVSGGTLALGAADRIANTSSITLNGGTFSTGGFNETLGALTLSTSSGINLGSGVSTLSFSAIGSFTAGATLSVSNYTQGVDRLFIGTMASLTAAQLAQINIGGVAVQQLATGEIVPVTSTAKIYYWKGDVDSNWSTNNAGNTNWSTDAAGLIDPGQIPDAATDVIFAATGASNLATVLGGDLSIKGLFVTTTAAVSIGGSGSLTLGVNGLAMSGTAGATTLSAIGGVTLGGTQTWANNSANSLTTSTIISGPFALSKAGTGTLILAADNVYTGGTTITGGTLQLGSGGSTGSVVGNIANNAALSVNRTTALTLSGTISGYGSITKSNANSLILSGLSSYSGDTQVGPVGGASIIRATANNALGTGFVTIFGNGGSNRLELQGSITLANPIYQSGRGATIGQTPSILNVSGDNTLNGPIVLQTGGTFSTIQSDGGLLTLANAVAITAGATTGQRGVLFTGTGDFLVSGGIDNGTSTAVLQIDKQGTGVLTLAGANSYTGATTVSNGTLALGGNERIANTSNFVIGNATFSTGGFNETLGTITLSDNATFNLGAGASTLGFAGIGTFAFGKTLNVINWTSGADHLFIGAAASLTATQLSQIRINGVPVTQLATGEVVPVTISIVANDFDYQVAPNALHYQFSSDVSATLDVNDVVVTRVGGGTITPSGVTYDSLTNTATFSFSTPIPDGDYTAMLLAAGVSDAVGASLAQDHVSSFFTLTGDMNHDRVVNFDDLLTLAQNYGTSGKNYGGGNLDYDAAGNVDFDDLLLLAQHYGDSVPQLAGMRTLTSTPGARTTAPRRKTAVLGLDGPSVTL